MKNKLTLALGCTALVLFTGCNQPNGPATPSQQKAEMVNTINNLPSWILNPTVEGGISSVGTARYSKHGITVMMPRAEMDARAKLAGQIQTTVSRIQENAMRNATVGELDEFDASFKQAGKEVIKKMPLSGAKRINVFQANDGTLYVHMVIEKREVSKHIESMKDTYKQHMADAKLSRKTIDEGMQVLDDMMKELDKEIQ